MKKIFLFMAMALSSVTLFSQIVLTRGGRVLYDIALEDAFAAYSEGMKLLKDCNDQIDKVEKKVLKLASDGNLTEMD